MTSKDDKINLETGRWVREVSSVNDKTFGIFSVVLCNLYT